MSMADMAEINEITGQKTYMHIDNMQKLERRKSENKRGKKR